MDEEATVSTLSTTTFTDRLSTAQISDFEHDGVNYHRKDNRLFLPREGADALLAGKIDAETGDVTIFEAGGGAGSAV